MTGKVRNLSLKGFGFIRSGRTDYFFHREDFVGHWNDLLEDYQHAEVTVEFEIGDGGKKGPRAANVKRVDFPNQSV